MNRVAIFRWLVAWELDDAQKPGISPKKAEEPIEGVGCVGTAAFGTDEIDQNKGPSWWDTASVSQPAIRGSFDRTRLCPRDR